jgi:amino acid transporter
MTKTSSGKGHGFNTAPVFLAAISTILGAILFLRFGYAVANAGLIGTLIIILLGHMITIPTALAIAEIATNLKVEGGGEYFIISRSFGSIIGGTIGISLYFSQAISVASGAICRFPNSDLDDKSSGDAHPALGYII